MLRQADVVGFDHFEDIRIVQDEVFEAPPYDLQANGKAVGQYRSTIRGAVERAEDLA